VRPWGFAALAVLLAAGNYGAWIAVRKPEAGGIDPFWAEMEEARIPGRADVAPHFPGALRAKEGERVSITGVAFVSPEGLEGDRVRWFVLMPPSRYGCCGISCDPRPELNVFVDCSDAPWPANGRRQVMVAAEGRLRLERGTASWCLSALEGAVVRPLDP
jgi:hypothetical protein